MPISNTQALDKYSLQELALEILSFAGGENTISEDQAMKTEEARQIENWDAISLGGMERSKGFNEVADGSSGYTNAPDLLIQHKDSGGTQVYAIIEGDLVYKDGTGLTQDDNGAFTSGVLSHGVSVKGSGFVWITNSTDGLKKKAVGVAIGTPASVPPDNCDRIYNHKNRLIAEGSANYPYRIYGSRTGIGNWTAADAWSLSNDSWSIDVPGDTRGMVMDFPSGNEQLVFTEEKAFALSNFPNTAFRPIGTPSRGCGAPYSIALGNEGVYFVSRRPTLGVFLFDGNTFTELTQYNKDVFVELIDFSRRIFGFYRDRKYYLIYNEINSGVSYPNRMRVYDAKFGRWMSRPVASALSDNFGYPAKLQYSSNEFYCASSQKDKIYELETTDDSDEGNNTYAVYKTKTFSSRDFALASGGQFPIDDVRIKLIKMTVSFYGTVGAVSVLWDADRGLHSGSKSIDLTASGANLNTTFTVNSSYITTTPADKTRVYTFPNNAVGRRFQFTFSNNGSSVRPKIKKIKITAVALEEA